VTHPRRKNRYPLLGAALAIGAPMGLLVVRAATFQGALDAGWIDHELRDDFPTYAYSFLSTGMVLAVLGRVLGRRQDVLVVQSTHDPLTGLANRSVFEPRLREELARSARSGTPLSLLVIDLDHLKVINDRSGHEAGDQALRKVAEVLRATSRLSDVAARIGGDEFVVLAPDTTAELAANLADRIRTQVAQHTVKAHPLSVSVGVADTTTARESPDTLFEAADHALYQAKRAGRGRTSTAPPLPRPAG
jgi:diguanylate cyclase (GGDEF)-like protein